MKQRINRWLAVLLTALMLATMMPAALAESIANSDGADAFDEVVAMPVDEDAGELTVDLGEEETSSEDEAISSIPTDDGSVSLDDASIPDGSADCAVANSDDADIALPELPEDKLQFEANPVDAAENAGIAIDASFFPDDAFRACVAEVCDANQDGFLSDVEIAGTTVLEIHGAATLEGIALFTELTGLDCSNGSLTTLDLSQNTKLAELNCAGNALTSLMLGSNDVLKVLIAQNNRLESLGKHRTVFKAREIW